ncbi:chemotaxis protein CheW [Hyalangium versicolor]|uniref:chemotaxis protein CheW n=1 Tax=Hyalangium versicolor TaxID=2861190 RepID=UPI001CCC9FF5|nr:chemotaxis protein CheW [Hyalangium versicolor]
MKLLPLHDEVPEAARTELEERAALLRRPPEQEVETQVVWVAEFPLGLERCILPLIQLRAVLPLKSMTPLPLAPPHTLGLLRFQGQVLSAHSLAALVGVKGWTRDPSVLIVVDGQEAGLIAFDCERIPESRALPLAAVEEARTRGMTVLLPGEAPLRLLDVPTLISEACRAS